MSTANSGTRPAGRVPERAMTSRRQLYVLDGRDAVLVKQGFCWPAFFLGTLWAAVKQLWWPVFPGLVLLEVLLWFCGGYAAAQGAVGLMLLALLGRVAYAWGCGHLGNRWWRSQLLRRGYLPGAER